MEYSFVNGAQDGNSITQAELTFVERRYNISFPKDLRDYYLTCNGKSIVDCPIDIGNTIYRVCKIVPVMHGDFTFEEIKERIADDSTIPMYFYPIGFDQGEGIFYWDANNDGIWFTRANDGSPPERLFCSVHEFFTAMNIAAIKGSYRREYKMSEVRYLPLGSVVLLKNGAHKVIIVGRGLNVENEGETFFFDYAGAMYPEGLIGDEMAYFNHNAVARVFFEGYRDDENEIMNERMNAYVEQHPELKRKEFT